MPDHLQFSTSYIFSNPSGAWRSGSRAQHHALAQYLSTSGERPSAVALLDYRLSVGRGEGVFHPAHLSDVFTALHYLLIERPLISEDEYDAENVVLAGHSVGAGMVAAACFDTRAAEAEGQMPYFAQGLRRRIKAWIMLDGIYDIAALLGEYPAYNNFVSQAFNAPSGSDYTLPLTVPSAPHSLLHAASLQSWTLAESYAYASDSTLPHIYILHSRDDTLLTYEQTLRAISHSVKQMHERQTSLAPAESTASGSLRIPSDCIAGKLDAARRRAWEADASLRLPLPETLHVDLELKLDHDAMLQTSSFHEYIRRIVERETKDSEER